MFGNQRKKVKKERTVDTSTSTTSINLEKLAELNNDQLRADITIDNLALAYDKNGRVASVSNAIASEYGEVYISVPGASVDSSQETYQVRLALQRKYTAESEYGTVIRYSLFKRIVDSAAAKKESVMEYLGSLGDFNTQLNEINIAGLYNLLNQDTKPEQYLANKDQPSDPESDLWKQLGVAFLSFLLMENFHKLSPMFTGNDEVKEANAEAASETELAKKVAKVAKVTRILIKVSEAVVLFALMHGLSKKQAQGLGTAVMPSDIPDDLKQDAITKISQVYDNPPAELTRVLVEDDNDDKLILEYAMLQIDLQKAQKNFTPWIVYALTVVRKLQMQDVATSLDGTSDEANKLDSILTDKGVSTEWRPPLPSIERDTMNYDIGPNVTPSRIDSDSGIGKYSDADNTVLGFNMNNYVQEMNEYSARSGETSDYFMSLMQNNHYTPELVCCLLKFLSKDLQFLKSLRAVLGTYSVGSRRDLGSLLSDIVNGLFTDLKSKIMSYAIGEISKFMGKIKKPILDWVDELKTEHEFIAFCTPIVDMAHVLLQIITEFESLLKDMVQEILDALLTFELTIDGGVIEMHGTTRYINIMAVLDAIILALENGQLCSEDLDPKDIHPDALPIIDRLSQQPRGDIQTEMSAHDRMAEVAAAMGAISADESLRFVHPFSDPADINLRPAVSLSRAYNGASTMETIDRYSQNCGAYRKHAAELLNRFI